MFSMPTHRTIEHHRFNIAPDFRHLIGCMNVGHALHRLLDNGAFIQLSRHVVGRGADQLYASLVRLMVRFRTLEAGQARVMNIDRSAIYLRSEEYTSELQS